MIIAVLTSSVSMAQTVKDNIEKLSRTPKTTENAAKADAKIREKKVIANPPGQSNKISNNKGTNSTSGRKKKTVCKSAK